MNFSKVMQIYNGKRPYRLVSEDGGKMHGWADASNVTAAGAATIAPFKEYRARVTANKLNIRKSAGTSYAVVGGFKDKGIYAIVNQVTGAGATK